MTSTAPPTAAAQPWTTLSQQRFSGRLDVRSGGDCWHFYFYLGRVLFVTGGIHPVRRWQRLYGRHCPDLTLEQLKGQIVPGEHWEYQLLGRLIRQGTIAREQGLAILRDTVQEVLIDLAQCDRPTYQAAEQPVPDAQLTLIGSVELSNLLQHYRESWRKAAIPGIETLSMHLAPVLQQPEQLRALTSPAVYQVLLSLLNGQRTFVDLASHARQDAFAVLRSLATHIESGVVGFASLPDLPSPLPAPALAKPKPASRGPLIACVDDSPSTCQTMERLLVQAGFRFMAIQDSLRAMPLLVQARPALIFLDLMMPNTNGYEVCAQLRKMSMFRNTPIVILTGNDGIIDRIRSRVVGSTDFLSKPIEPDKLLGAVHRHLPQPESLSEVLQERP